MARTIASLSVSINARTRGLSRGLKNASNLVGKFRSDVTDLAGRMAKLGAGFALVGAGAVGFGLQRTIASMSDLAKVSDKLSIDPTPLIALRDAAQESGVQVKTFDMGLQRMLRRIQEASRGAGEAKDTLADLGLSAQRLAQMKPEEQFVEIAKAMGDAADEGLDLSRAMKLFDSEGVALINTLRAVNEKGLEHFISGVKESGRAVARAELVPSESIEDRMKRLGDRVGGIFTRLVKVIGPSLDSMLGKFERFLSSPDAIKPIDQAFRELGKFIRESDQHLKRFLDRIDDGKESIVGFGSDVAKITSAIGTIIGGAAAATEANFSGGNITGTPGVAIMDRAFEDAARILGDIPDRLKATGDEIIEGVMEFGRELRRSAGDVVDDLTGAKSGGFIRSSSGRTTELGNQEAVRQLEQINQTLKQGVGFGTNPASLPAGTMIIRVQG